MRKMLKRQGMVPDEWVTDKNPAYDAALRTLKLTRAPHTRRKPPKLVAVALANKLARIAWKLMATGEAYAATRSPVTAAGA